MITFFETRRKNTSKTVEKFYSFVCNKHVYIGSIIKEENTVFLFRDTSTRKAQTHLKLDKLK